MPRFQVQRSFQIEDQHPLFALTGSILEGSLHRGMFVRIPLNASLLVAPIHEIEFPRTLDRRQQVCLIFRPVDADELEQWRGLNIDDEILEVTTDGPV